MRGDATAQDLARYEHPEFSVGTVTPKASLCEPGLVLVVEICVRDKDLYHVDILSPLQEPGICIQGDIASDRS